MKTTNREVVGLRRSLLWIAAVCLVFGAALVAVGLMNSGPEAGLVGSVAFSLGIWLVYQRRLLGAGSENRIVRRVSIVLLLIPPLCAILFPPLRDAVAISTIVPVLLAIAFVDLAALRRIMVLGAASGVVCSVGSRAVVAPASMLEPAAILGSMAVVTAFAVVFGLLWVVSRRLKDGASDLRSVVAMSGDLTQSLDPQLVGNSIAAHIALAVGAEECGLNYLDADGDRLVVHGYFPPDRASFVDPWYSASAYPATRLVIDQQRPYVAHADDPDADPREVEFLHSIGQRSIAILPLVATGKTVGTIEMTANHKGAFDARSIELATMLATEAAMALENARLYDQIHHQAFHDGLTGLSNRALFRDQVQHSLDIAKRRPGAMIALLYVDLDAFKTLNDRIGHGGGDDLLVTVAERLLACLRPGDKAARLGGDEFAILLESIVDVAHAQRVADRILASLATPVRVADTSVSVIASIGIDIATGGTETVDDLLRNADAAMYVAKSDGGGQSMIFRPELREDAATRSQLARQLEGAADRGELRLDFQPIVDLATGQITGLESLVRWQPADRPLLMPDSFIGLAEETGAIHSIGRWVLRESCRTLREWQTRFGLADLNISVNLTASQFDDPEIVELVRVTLEETELPARSLTLEITESGLMRDTPLTIDRLVRLRELGIRVAIDDFGTGYSSLSYLEQFPIDILKIDRSFVSGPRHGAARSVLAQVIVDLGRTLNLAVVAEGIETEDQAAWVRSLGCAYGQGYLFARPLGASAVEVLLAQEPEPAQEPAAAISRRPRSTSRARRRRAGSPDLRLVAEA